MKRAPKPERRWGDGGPPTPRPPGSPSPWADIDAAKRTWDAERRSLDAQLVEAGVKQRVRSKTRTRVPLVTVDDRGVLVVALGCGVRITGRDAATLLAAVPGALAELAAERKARKARRKEVLAARAEAAERLQRRRAELAAGGAR